MAMPNNYLSESSRLLNALSLTGMSGPEYQHNSFGGDASNNTAFRHPKQMASIDSLHSVVDANNDKDPFVISTPVKTDLQGQSKLSATASAFTPVSTVLDTPVVVRGVNAADELTTPKPTDDLVAPIARSPTTGKRTFQDVPVSSTLSFDLGYSRSLRVTNPSVGVVYPSQVEEYLEQLQFQTLGAPFESRPQVIKIYHVVYIRYGNIRDAVLTLMDKTVKPDGWQIEAVSAKEINEACNGEDGVLAMNNEGLHTVLVSPIAQMSESAIQDKIRDYFKHFDVFALVKQQTSQIPGTMCWVIEFSDIDSSYGYTVGLYSRDFFDVDGLFRMALGPYPAGMSYNMPPSMHLYNLLNVQSPMFPGVSAKDLTAQLDSLSLYNSQQRGVQAPAIMNSPVRPAHPTQYPWNAQGVVSGSPTYASRVFHSVMAQGHTPTGSMNGSRSLAMSSVYSSPQSMPRSNNPSPRFQRQGVHRQNAPRVSRQQHFAAPGPHHNHVDVNKIREGVDVRTTIMLRNIPNKVDQAMLEGIIDESSWGKYDFMYLRIDFANDCNVGYAFINFVDPLDIIDFVNAHANQRWNCFKSDKIAEVSYATIQGKDCLVQKFRNSSVMLEAPHYRPKLYYTTNGPVPELAGSEEPFPPPDNQSKMKRSCENAEHVGLFTPHAGQHFRDEQRRRRSQFDRGTRLAALEECGGMYNPRELQH